MEKEEILLKIAQIISNNDEEILAEAKDNIDNVEQFVQEHLEDFEERQAPVKYETKEDMQWLAVMNILIRNNYVVQLSENCTITDFGWALRSLRTFKEYGLSLDSKFVEEDYGIKNYDYDEDDEYDYYNEESEFINDEEIVGWCKYLDSKWFDEDICVAMINLSEDMYTLFLTSEEELEMLEDLAEGIGQIISSVY